MYSDDEYDGLAWIHGIASLMDHGDSDEAASCQYHGQYMVIGIVYSSAMFPTLFNSMVLG